MMHALRYLTTTIVAALLWLGMLSSPLWGQSTASDQAILRLQHLLQRNSRDASVYYRLGDAYIQKARETGALAYINLAEKALQRCLEIDPRHSGAARHLAYATYMRHAFDESTAQARKAVALDPTDGHAYGILGDAYLEVGKYAEATQAYRRMVQLQEDLYAYSRLSGLKSLQGDMEGAIADLERAIRLGQMQERPPESIAWAMWQLGNERLARGDLTAAETGYHEALKTFPGYYRAFAGLAQVHETARAPEDQLSSSPLEGEDSGGGGRMTVGELHLPIERVRLEVNRQLTPRSPFTELVTAQQLGLGIILVAMAASIGLGAFHALEPGHRKTVVAAYLVGSRGTAWHAVILGLIVTVTHTAGVYILGAVTLFASRYIVPERLYPWLGAISGLMIAALGPSLFLRRYAGLDQAHDHTPDHAHDHDHAPAHPHGIRGPHTHAHGHRAHQHRAHHHHAPSTLSGRELLTLGVTGGIIPYPAALVVLLSALSLNRVGFGLLLIVAFSVGLAAVLIAIGILMVCAQRLMARFQGDGALVRRWLPLTSAALMTVFGVIIAVQALVSAGILPIRL